MKEYDPMIGKQLGAYLIQKKVGEGGMARVYKAYHARLRRDVAIKVISSHRVEDSTFQVRFEREAQLIASLEHRNIVAIYDFGEIEHLTYLVMQYVGGGTLRNQLRDGNPIEARRAAYYTLQMARALHHAHLKGIVHRDVKPQNMLVASNDNSQLLLSDFGIAKLFDSSQESTAPFIIQNQASSDQSITRVDQIIGTAEYMAPEQITRKTLDARTDVYSLGVVLFQMLTGRVPFQSTTDMGLLYQHMYKVPPPVRQYNPNVPPILAHATAKALEKSPEARFQSAEEMAQVLEAALTTMTGPFSAPLTYERDLTPNNYGSQLTVRPTTGSPISSPQQVLAAPPVLQSTPHHSTSSVDIAKAQPKVRYAIQGILATSVFLIAMILIIARAFPQLGNALTGKSTSAQAFSETFQDDQRSWQPTSAANGLSAEINNRHLILTVDNQPETNYHFPYPDAVGTLPANFVLSADISQTQGSKSSFYGLAFRMHRDGSKLTSYAFVINQNREYRLLKFDPNAKIIPTILQKGQLPAQIQISQQHSNQIQANVNGGSFRFSVDGVEISINGGTTVEDSTSPPYSDGQLALVVTGPNASYTVSKVQLTLT